ncbi:MAG: hypothetical protein HFF37_06455 [Coprobacillus sp.]|nr:hypothetical protein [Coprobacillus sp.]
MKLYMSDLYRVELHYPLDEVQNDILYYLYQPLIGTNALSTYMMLYTEGKRMSRFLKPSSLSRLVSFLSSSLMDLEKHLKALEAIGLLKTYVRHENNITQYIFIIQSPLTLKTFFRNQILSSLLQESLTQDDFQKTIQYFKISQEDLSGYENITSSFTDVYTIQHKNKTTHVLQMKEFKEKQVSDIDILYDMDLLMKGLQDYQIPRSLLTKDDLKYMAQLGSVYSIDALTLAGMVKEAMCSNQLDKKLLKNKIQKYCDINSMSSLKEVHHKQPLQYQTQNQQQTPLVLHMQYLDAITPYELLKEKQGGSEPVFHDLMIIETLMVQLGLKPSVVNVLIEYVLGKNKNRLSKRYCEAIGSSWARKHIETAMDAYHELMNENIDNQESHQDHLEEQKLEQTEVNSEKLFSLLDKLEEGQL